MKALKLNKLRFWKQWLLNSFLFWVSLSIAQLLSYIYRVQILEDYPLHADGTPVTYWELFINYNYTQAVGLVIAYQMLLAEANYRFVFKKRSTWQIIITCYIFGILGSIYFLVADYLKFGLWRGIKEILLIGAILAIIFFLYALLRDFIYKRIHAAEIKLDQSQAELNTLKAQVNPHFFFNTLNSLYGTALEENAPRTADSIEELAGIMRYTMNEAQQDFTPLANELKFIKDYLHLQRLRLPERLNIGIQTEIKYDGKPAAIAPMLLIPFIENAFKYGISIDHPSYVNIRLHVENQKLTMVIRNSVVSNNVVSKGQGTGIRNTQKRLQLLYPDWHQLKITESENHFEVSLQLELK